VAHDVFISYSSKDKPTADAVCATLERTGLRCWIAPRDILPGEDWGASIIDAINGSKAMVLVYSSHANESPQIRREIERAVHKQIAVVPFRIEDVPMSKSLEYFISTPHWLDALTPPLERHIEYLAETLRRLVHLPPAGPTPIPGRAVAREDASLSSGAGLKTRAAPIVIGVGLLAIAAAVWLRPGSSGPSSARPADAALGDMSTTAAPAARVIDPRLVGTWTTRATVNNLPVTIASTVAPDGQLVVTSTLTDRGRYGSGNGRWTMTNSARQTLRGTYSFVGGDAMSMAGPLGTATWTRRPGSPPDPHGRITGVWTLEGTAPDGLPATTTLSFAPDGTYVFEARSRDVQRIAVAEGGRWQGTSTTTGKTFNGAYVFTGADAVQWSSQDGTALWNRSRR
jgi:hypothetical protein